MKIIYIILAAALFISCRTTAHFESECTQAEIESEVLFEQGEYLSGKLYSVIQKVRPGVNTPPPPGRGPHTVLRALLQRELGPEESWQRPILIGEDEFVLLSVFNRGNFFMNIEDQNFSDSLSIDTWLLEPEDRNLEFSLPSKYKHNEHWHDYDRRKVRAVFNEITSKPAAIFSMHRCGVVHKLFGGVKVFWSDDEYMKVALFISPEGPNYKLLMEQ